MSVSFTIDNHLFFPEAYKMPGKTLSVSASQYSYCVHFPLEKKSSFLLNALIKENPRNVIVMDQIVFSFFENEISFTTEKICRVVALEKNKTIETVMQVVNFFSAHGITKSDQVIIVGGGIIQEIAAFACAIFQRGIPYIHFPTTLLSMCDSCIGGKTSLNYGSAKNQLGLFYPPTSVYICSDFLKTMLLKEIKSGLGEILKSCIIGGNIFLDVYQTNKNAYDALIFSALSVKKAIVEADEFESNYRRALNYGHTLGHAIEAWFDYRIPHGESVAIGMILENHLSYQNHLLPENELFLLNTLCISLLDHNTKELIGALNPRELISLIKRDKKTQGTTANFALLKGVGEICFVRLALDDTLVEKLALAFDAFLRL